MWPFKRKDNNQTESKGALMGALLAFQSSPVLHMRQSAADDLVAALMSSSAPDEQTGTDHIFVGSRPVPVAYWGGGSHDGMDEETPYDITTEGVAIIPVCGMLVNREPEYWFRWYGYASTPHIGRMLDMAASDARVKSILLYMDSPGGHSAGIPEVASKVAAIVSTGEKRVVGWGKDICSACYHIGSQCEELYVSLSGFSGCIGTLMTPADYSKMYAEWGVRRLRITSTGAEKLKGAGTSGTVITAEQEADWKRLCDEIQALFSADVMQGRGFDAATMSALATGQYWVGQVGVEKKLVDGVSTAEDVLAALGSGGTVKCHACTEPTDDLGDTDAPASDDTATESSRGNNPRVELPSSEEEPMDEKTQDSLASKIVAGLKGAFGNNKPDPAQTELAKLQAENKKREEDALKSAREAATAAATAAYGPGTPELTNATAAIEASSDTSVLAALESAYKVALASKPAGRQTAGNPTTPPTTPGAPEAEANGIKPEEYTDIYAAYNKPQGGK